MHKVKYYNKDNEPCIRHGIVIEENDVFILLPSDLRIRIIIPKDKFINKEESSTMKYKFRHAIVSLENDIKGCDNKLSKLNASNPKHVRKITAINCLKQEFKEAKERLES